MVDKNLNIKAERMDFFNAALAALMPVMITMTVRDWIRALKEASEERCKQREKMRFYK